MSKKKKLFLIRVLVMIVLAWGYQFPLYRVFAEKKYAQYAEQQGASITDVKSKDVYKDYKQGGYYITVKYHSDPDHVYDYQYYLIQRGKENTRFNIMYYHIFDMENNQLDDFSKVVYKPIE